MRIEVMLGEALPTPGEVMGKIVVVVDVLRAATTVATALANGARAVIPFDRVDEPAMLAKQYHRDEIRLAGERKMQRIPGFELGNSPAEYTRESVAGRKILYSTTNGTAALLATHGARASFFCAFVNCAATTAVVRALTRSDGDLVIVCAGHDRRVTIEDVVCAGRLARGIARGRTSVTWGDGARAASLIERNYRTSIDALAKDATHARALVAAGFEADVNTCLSLDTQPIVVALHDRQLQLYERSVEKARRSATAPG